MGRQAHDGGDGEDDEEGEGGARVLMDVAPVPPSVPIYKTLLKEENVEESRLQW